METFIDSALGLRRLNDLNETRKSNLLLYSEDFSKNIWNNYLGVKSLSSTNILDPLSGSYVKSISGSSSIFQDSELYKIENILNKQFTFSIYAHNSSKATYIEPSIKFVECGSFASVKFDPKNGNVISKDGGADIDFCASEYIGNGWYKYYLSTTQLTSVDTTVRTEIFYNTPSLNASPWQNNIILWGAQLQRGNISKKYYKTIDAQKSSLLEEGFLNLENTEPSFGLPYTVNLLTQSQTYSANTWNNFQLTLTANENAFLSPISSFDVYKLTPTANSSLHYISQTLTVPQTGLPYTFSTYVREDKNNLIAYRYAQLKVKSSANQSYFSALMNLDDGSLVQYEGSNVYLSAISITPSFSGWYRFSITGQYDFYSNLTCEIYCGQHSSLSLSFAGNNSRHIYIWGSQFEQGILPSKYIRTYSNPITSVSYQNVYSNTDSNSAYYFLLATDTPNKDYPNSRRFTGKESLFLNKNNISYNNQSPTYNFDVSGNFHALSAYFNTLSTNFIKGETVKFTNFDSVSFDTDIFGEKIFNFNYLSANQVFTNLLSSLSTLYINIPVPSICANKVFSSITWNVTSVGYTSAYDIIVKNELKTPFISGFNSFIHNLSTDYLTVTNKVCSLSSFYAKKINGFLEIDKTSPLYYNDKVLSTRLSSVYFLGIKPSDIYSTDNINFVRSLTGAWEGSNGSIRETYPVLKPYFRNIRQALNYATRRGLYGKELNVLIYDDILSTNIDDFSDTLTGSGTKDSGNLRSAYIANPPTFLQSAGAKAGNYIWVKDNTGNVDGDLTYLNIPRLNFEDINFYGMYEIGTKVIPAIKSYTTEKPFNYLPRKIIFRNYLCSNKNISFGSYGSNSDEWLKYNLTSRVTNQPIVIDSHDTDITFSNLCFEFDGNINTSGLKVISGNVYLQNITIALLGSAIYPDGALQVERYTPNVYICGKPQIDPFLLLDPSYWDSSFWLGVSGFETQTIFPGYGLNIVGNPTNPSINPSYLPNGFITTYNKGKVFIMDYKVNRRVGRFSYLNSSIILNGKFSAPCFYNVSDGCKIYANNHVFRTNTFTLSNLRCSHNTPDGSTINLFYNTNVGDFEYVKYSENFGTFAPHNFDIFKWSFYDANDLLPMSPPYQTTTFASKFINSNSSKYIIDPTTNTINLSGYLYGTYQKNSLRQWSPINDNMKFYGYIDPSNIPLFENVYKIRTPFDNDDDTFVFTLSSYAY